MKKWGPLVILAAAQFLMVLDQAVMNVSISQLVADFDTTVTTIQGVITLYSLTMAMLMVTGGKIGDLIGRRRAFIIGLVIYACGSGLTAVSQSVFTLTLGWSVLEGVGAALVLPALAALIAGNYEGKDRAVAYSVIGGVAGAGIAVGPIVGGWATTELTWRVVFIGEVVIVLAILAGIRLLGDAPGPERRPHLDGVGSVLSAAGLGLIVFGFLQASTWGWISPKSSPVTPFGFALTPFVIAGGGAVLWLFVVWQHHRVDRDRDPLIHLELFRLPPLRSGLQTFLAQNLILMGVFFTIPLYLQMVLGLDALETGIKMLPVSVAMFLAAVAGPRLSQSLSTRTIVRVGLAIVTAGVLGLLASIDPELNGATFAISMALLGVGMGLVASQLGNVVQSSVDASGRSEAGGLQYTAQQLGSAIGVALIGAIVLTGLVGNFTAAINEDPRIDPQVAAQATANANANASFVPASTVEKAATDSGLDPTTVDAFVTSYEDAQLFALKGGLLAAAAIALTALLFTKNLPSQVPDPDAEPASPDSTALSP
jgi:EmrB/QacA subfamily drug resistance transporter